MAKLDDQFEYKYVATANCDDEEGLGVADPFEAYVFKNAKNLPAEVELTKEEIEEKLGYKIKIVNQKS